MTQAEVSLGDRELDYHEAVEDVEAAAAEYVEARASGQMSAIMKAGGRLDVAQKALRRAQRRLEGTERRLAKASAPD